MSDPNKNTPEIPGEPLEVTDADLDPVVGGRKPPSSTATDNDPNCWCND